MTKSKKLLALTLAMLLLLTMAGCSSEEITETTAPSTEETMVADEKPTLVVERTRAKAGEKQVEITIEVKNNPGILGIDFDLFYDESVMTLVDAQSTLAADGYTYTEPAYFRNPTTFLWDSQDATWTQDGVFLKLYFDIADTAPAGDHEIKIMYSYGNIFDTDLEAIDIGVKNGHISITQ